jgi:ABC-type antimicrobial peptide transport system permease subunit
VVRDTKFKSLAKPAPEMIYLPSLQGPVFAATVKIELRSGMQPKALAAAVQTRIRNLRLPLKVESAVTLDDEIGTSLLNERIRMQASGLFGGLSLLLICIGIHGLMAYAVARRSREIGIRMAIGATPLAIGWQVWKDTLRIVLAGIVLAIPGLFAAMKAISGFLFGLPSFDFESAAIAALAMLLTALIGSALPALRAACLNPVDALRTE